ncbi:SatD family protein [Microbacterium pseudoresistens]|uniref:SatD family protein n=1 Tax=Microbacterium pseudoresistens TaxID=640634 RepID=A0A7Y9JLT9_9MICO|nr:SatD family protein [Microbacterium pseudoresistens]NYD53680.1 hypothetical protein [Microbacterium pseudoresistens]
MDVAVIADIVGSRALPDRSAAQRVFEDAVERAERDLPVALEPLRPTAGDELQGRYASLDAALAAILLIQLGLPDGHELRFGIGIGEIRPVDSDGAPLQDGPGWWAARAAIDAVHARQQRAVPSSRSGIVAGQGEDDAMRTLVDLADAYLLARDEIVTRMSERERRLTRGRCLQRTQSALAAAEGISQSAVSQALQSAGAGSVVAGYARLVKGIAA